MFLSGIEIDVAARFPELDAAMRARAWETLGSDPVSAAQAATHFIRNVVDKLILGGVFGKVKCYYVSVETQQRGSLHFHVLITLEGAPSTTAGAKAMLAAPGMKERIVEWTDAVIQQSKPEMPDAFNVDLVSVLHT